MMLSIATFASMRAISEGGADAAVQPIVARANEGNHDCAGRCASFLSSASRRSGVTMPRALHSWQGRARAGKRLGILPLPSQA